MPLVGKERPGKSGPAASRKAKMRGIPHLPKAGTNLPKAVDDGTPSSPGETAWRSEVHSAYASSSAVSIPGCGCLHSECARREPAGCLSRCVRHRSGMDAAHCQRTQSVGDGFCFAVFAGRLRSAAEDFHTSQRAAFCRTSYGGIGLRAAARGNDPGRTESVFTGREDRADRG